MSAMANTTLSKKQSDEILKTLKTRFEKT